MNSSVTPGPLHALLRGALAACMALAGTLTAKMIDPVFKVGPDGAITYVRDELGNQVPDFSSAGYRGGGVPIPDLPVRVVVTPADGDDLARIQAAIDHVSGLAPDAEGMRGAVLVSRGRYEISGQIRLAKSGVVLRGEGPGPDGTVLVATGTDRRPLILIAGRADRKTLGAAMTVADSYVPVGATQLRVGRADPVLRAGTRITIERPSPAAWVEQLGMHDGPGRQPYSWRAGSFNVRWDRVITAVTGNTLTLDAPMTVALEAALGGGTVTAFEEPAIIADAGVENLRCEAQVNPANPLDEDHAWNAIDLHAARDIWVANVTAAQFAGTLVQVGVRAARVTVQDCAWVSPVSERGGYRRLAYHTRGQQALFLRCTSEFGGNDFTAGYLAAGPNVFLECFAHDTRGFSGSIGSWASGLLFDNVMIDGGSLRLDNLETWNQGVGWAAANSVIYQSSAAVMTVRRPPGAANWAIGPWAQFIGDGWWDRVNEFIRPVSLYRAQLAARLGAKALDALAPRTYQPPAVTVARIDAIMRERPANAAGAPRPAAPATEEKRLTLTADGWLAANGALLAGGEQGNIGWWQGRLEPARTAEYGISLTRFAPGRTGTGVTDELPSIAAAMRAANNVVIRHHYGLWYDRRRMDHERVRRPDGDVWPPFFEQPFARSGQGTAWDGLSRYDLTKYNPWYFGRLREFAALGRQHGLVLVNEMYFQHNILEAGAHWADSPWRPVNALQPTGFPEPPPYVESDGAPSPVSWDGKRIFIAEQFYDVTHPVRRELHRAYIRQCLANLAEEPNVIHTLTAENSGPLHFMQFWLDVVGEWERETGKQPLIALSAPKDVQDAILADPVRSRLIDVIDFAYWWRTDNGLYAPPGGVTLAPRQHLRGARNGNPSAHSVAGMVREYRAAFPAKAVISSIARADGWAFVAAGGSLPKLPATTDPALLAALARMQPLTAFDAALPARQQWTLAGPQGDFLIYAADGAKILLPPAAAGASRTARFVDLKTGRVLREEVLASAGATVSAGRGASAGQPLVLWLTRN